MYISYTYKPIIYILHALLFVKLILYLYHIINNGFLLNKIFLIILLYFIILYHIFYEIKVLLSFLINIYSFLYA